jgi:DNA-binding NtrC family response regulator
MGLQAKLLRVIQEKSFERIGGNELIKSDARIISATNRDLKKAVEEKLFREDLFYRLNSFPINLPPLRTRRSDVLILAAHFLSVFNAKTGKNIKGFTRRATNLMYEYDWPGNVREMENAVERCILLTDNDIIDIDDFPLHIRTADRTKSLADASMLFSGDEIIPLEKIKEEAIRHALRVSRGKIFQAAKKLQLGRATLYRLIEKYKIDIDDYNIKLNEGE